MVNVISNGIAGLLKQAQVALAGVIAKAVALGLVHSKAAVMTLNITNANLAIKAHDDAKVAWENDRNAYKNQKKAVRAFLRISREVLRPYFGDTFNATLAGAGFNGTFALPTKVEDMLLMLTKLKGYLTDHPEQENEALTVTALRAGTLATDLANLEASVTQKKEVTQAKKEDRDAKLKLVRLDMLTLLGELRTVLDPLSTDWTAFGFKRPGILAIADVPVNVIAVLIGANAAAVKWDKAARATNYRIYKRVVGVDEDFVYVDTRPDLDYLIEGLPAGATIEIAIAATNSGGETAKSAIATVVTAA